MADVVAAHPGRAYHGALAATAGTLGLSIAIAALVSNGNIVLALAPLAAIGALAGLCLLPIPRIVLALVFLGLSLDTSRDAFGKWQSPVEPLGRLLFENLNKTVPADAAKFSLLAIVVAFLLVRLWVFPATRRVVRPAGVVWNSIVVAFLVTAGICLYGMARHGDGQMMNLELQNYLLAIAVAYIAAATFEKKHVHLLFRIVVLSAVIKAVMALWVRYGTDLFANGLAFATTHGDSMLFSIALALLGVWWYEGRSEFPRRWLIPPAMALLLAGIQANNRRLAWMEVAFTLMTLAVLAPRTRAKQMLCRTVLLASPLVLIYAAAGWHSNSTVFAPVKLLRSVADGKSDRSTQTRDVENFNLISTFAQNRLLGVGFGQPYSEIVKGDDISRAFAAYRYVPHNSVLWLWAAGGLVGFTAIWAVPAFALFAGRRAYGLARSGESRIVAFFVVAMAQIYMLQCWGDMGFVDLKVIFLLGPALAIAIRLSKPAVPAAIRQAAA